MLKRYCAVMLAVIQLIRGVINAVTVICNNPVKGVIFQEKKRPARVLTALAPYF